jgi:hypothetical protein
VTIGAGLGCAPVKTDVQRCAAKCHFGSNIISVAAPRLIIAMFYNNAIPSGFV